METIELKRMDGGSFYRKAHVICHFTGGYTLKSYDTLVARIDDDGVFTRLWDGWSATTARHIDAFRQRYGDSLMGSDTAISKAEWLEMGVAQ